MTGLLEGTIAAIGPLDEAAVVAARERQEALTKPSGSLGRLEDVSVQLAGIAGVCPPPLPEPAVVAVFAADHGVHAQGVSPWPQEVTAQMVANFLASGAAVNAIAKQAGASVCVVDIGVAADLPMAPGLLARKVRAGTADMTAGPAMSQEEARRAVETGISVARELVAEGHRCLITGDMGIANTTASAALIAVFTGATAALVTGRGTGIDDTMWARKVDVVRRALELHRCDPAAPLDVLAAVGGLEQAALAGFILGGAELRVPVLLDGVIACAAALAARAFAPQVADYLIAGHLSTEPAALRALHALGLRPLLDLGMRLGEGSGAVLALPVVAAAARVLRDMATFDSAGVSSEKVLCLLMEAAGPWGRFPPTVLRNADGKSPHAPCFGGARFSDCRAAPSGVRARVRESRPGLLPPGRMLALPGRPRRGKPFRVLILGGARSGKSVTAERLLAGRDRVDYVASGPLPSPADPDWAERVRVHQERRPAHWATLETLDLEDVLAAAGRVDTPLLVDCLSTWLAGVMDECGLWTGAADADKNLAERVDGLVDAWRSTRRQVVAVSNEVGSGVVPATVSGIRFRDELGVLNARIAAESEQVWLCVAGLAQRLR
jgi:nicotinate-nucleotide--dimethylbenzimidazole phosphoribosyltransferase